MVLLFELIDRTIEKGEKILVFSQSLLTLNIIEHYLSKRRVPRKLDPENPVASGSSKPLEHWTKGWNYCRIDGLNEFFRSEQFHHRISTGIKGSNCSCCRLEPDVWELIWSVPQGS